MIFVNYFVLLFEASESDYYTKGFVVIGSKIKEIKLD